MKKQTRKTKLAKKKKLEKILNPQKKLGVKTFYKTPKKTLATNL